jgi:hypothetical protein
VEAGVLPERHRPDARPVRAFDQFSMVAAERPTSDGSGSSVSRRRSRSSSPSSSADSSDGPSPFAVNAGS